MYIGTFFIVSIIKETTVFSLCLQVCKTCLFHYLIIIHYVNTNGAINEIVWWPILASQKNNSLKIISKYYKTKYVLLKILVTEKTLLKPYCIGGCIHSF